MPFYVYGRDRPGALPEMIALAEAHWSYGHATPARTCRAPGRTAG